MGSLLHELRRLARLSDLRSRAAFAAVVELLVGGAERVAIPGLGTFRRRRLRARAWRDPLRDKLHHLPAMWTLAFRPSSAAIRALNTPPAGARRRDRRRLARCGSCRQPLPRRA